MRRMARLLISAILFLVPFGLLAGEGNYRDFIVGDRAAGMGGAALALATSVESCFYNPGGLARTENNTVSLSTSIYGFSKYQVKDGLWSLGGGRDIDTNSFLVIPTAFGSVWKLDENWRVAFSAFVPQMDRSNELLGYPAGNSGEYYKDNKDDQTIWLGPSISCRLDDTLSVGVSLLGVYRSYSWFRDMLFMEYVENDGWYFNSWSEDIEYNDLSLLPIFGVHYQYDPHWSFGLTLQPPSVHLSGSGKYLQKSINLYTGMIDVAYMDDVDTKNTLPAQVAAGVAWSDLEKWTFAFDLIYHFSDSYSRIKGEDQLGRSWHIPIKFKSVVDFSLGGEYYVAQNYPLRAGFFTSLSAAPSVDPASGSYPAHINKYGVTASIGRETENTALNIGINYSWGSGEYRGVNENFDWVEVDAEESFLYVFAGTSYFF